MAMSHHLSMSHYQQNRKNLLLAKSSRAILLFAKKGKNMKTRLIVAMCVLLTICGCGKKKTVQNTTFSGKDYVLQFPETWEINDTGLMGMDLIGLSPLENAEDAFRENVNVVLENLPKSMTAKEYLRLALANLEKIYGLPIEKNFTKARVGNHEGYSLHYSLQVGQNEMDNDIYIVINNNAVYVLTCSNAKGKRDIFKTTMDTVIETFTIK